MIKDSKYRSDVMEKEDNEDFKKFKNSTKY